MGSRGNVFITNTKDEEYQRENPYGSEVRQLGIYVYSHWDGHELPEYVQAALLRGRDRWTDPQYLARILVDQICVNGRDQDTGYGIGLTIGDNSFPITIVDLGLQEVAWAAEGRERDRDSWVKRTDFTMFVKQQKVGYPPGL